jgi:hypothetical protein
VYRKRCKKIKRFLCILYFLSNNDSNLKVIEIKNGSSGIDGEHHDNTESHSHMHERSAFDSKVQIQYHTWTLSKGTIQHSTMYSGFLLKSIIEIMIYHGVELPSKLDYVFGIMAYSIEAFLFAFHLHGREIVGIHVHLLLVYAIVGCVIMHCLEAYDDKQILFTYGKIMFMTLQGTWIFQVKNKFVTKKI